MGAIENIEVARDKVETAQGSLQLVDAALETAEDVAVEIVRTRSRFRSFVRFMLLVAVILGIAMAIRAILESQSSGGAPEASFEPAPPTPEPVVDDEVAAEEPADDESAADEAADEEDSADAADEGDDSEDSPADES